MSASGIKSKPVYSPLRADVGGRYHVMLGGGVGGVALLRVLRELEQAAPAGLRQTHVLFAPGAAIRDAGVPNPVSNDASETLERLRRTELAGLRLFDDTTRLLAEFRALFEQSLMGTRL